MLVGLLPAELTARKIASSTMVVLTAKHGQSPADRSRLNKIGHAVGTALGNYVGGGSDAITGNNLGHGQVTDDDVAFVWLNDQSQRAAALHLLRSTTACPAVNPVTRIVSGKTPLICADNGGSVVDLSAGKMKFGDPANGRTPDIMVQPNPGVIYTTSGAKDMEHGGFAPDDGRVALLVSQPGLVKRTVDRRVRTTQVAPTILTALGLEPGLLRSVVKEGTRVLPSLWLNDAEDVAEHDHDEEN